ncbi:MAG TPA: protein translocase subunit SecF [Acidimicrobiales bacterium]|nr:protein translocase subunit SecF [Acidimicrobiales bacterium]
MPEAGEAAPVQRSIWHKLYHGETTFEFIGRKRTWFILSFVVIVIGAGSLATRHLNFGIDFEGGTAWEVKAPGVSVKEARSAMRPVGQGNAKIQVLGGKTLRVQGDVAGSDEKRAKDRDEVSAALAKLAGTTPNQVSVNEVGPSWGGEVTKKAERALVFFFIAITLYITLRFEWKMAIAALAAVVHDIAVTVGIYSLSGFEVTPATVIAFLTILGYSLYDTIVVFDKVEENTRGLAASGRLTYGDTVNLSMNQVLMRSINTSLVAILPILSVLVIGSFVLGATTLEDFGLALLIGLLTGAYSSIFIAAPILAMLKEREPRYAAIKQRVLARGPVGPLTPAAAAGARAGMATSDGGSGPAGDARPGPHPTASRPPPRPRKKGKRR